MKVKDVLDITYCKNIFIVNTEDKVLWKLSEGICENPDDPSDELQEREVVQVYITQAGSLILYVNENETSLDMSQLTNRDWLNSLSDEQFRDFFLSHLKVKVKVFLDGGDTSELITKISYQGIIRSDIQSDIGFLEWLKAPCVHTEIVEDDPYN